MGNGVGTAVVQKDDYLPEVLEERCEEHDSWVCVWISGYPLFRREALLSSRPPSPPRRATATDPRRRPKHPQQL